MIHFSTTSLILHYTDVEAYYKDIIFFDVSVYLTLSNQTESDRQTDRQKSQIYNRYTKERNEFVII